MSKDLEIIKRSMTGNGKYRDELTDEVIAAAERMSAEIEAQSKVGYAAQELLKDKNNEIARLKVELEKYKGDVMEKCPDGIIRECCYDEVERQFKPENNITMTSEVCAICVALREKITYWKHQFDLEVAGRKMAESELEKRPEVVYCEGCIYKNQCKAAVIFQESTPKMEGPFKFYYLKFCSYGQRKSEEK